MQVALLNESVVRLDACALTSIPPEVYQKKQLKELILSRNSLTVRTHDLSLNL